jgi:beta-phosphoglucomutase
LGASRVRPLVPLRALVLDVDGVLVQSMERHHEAYRRVFADYRIDVRKEDVFANEGRRSREVIEALGRARGLRLSDAELDAMAKRKQEIFSAFGPLPLYPGAAELVARAREAGLRLAAVTGTARLNVDRHLGVLTKRFDVIVTADDVSRGKPDPEPYAMALAKLGLPPAEAVVVENAPLGIRSAKAAKLRVIAVTSTLPRDALREADVVVAKLADAWPAVEAMRK